MIKNKLSPTNQKRVLIIGASGFLGEKLFSVGKSQEGIALSIFTSGKVVVEHLTASGKIEREYLKDEDRDVIDGLLKQPNLLPQYLHAKGIFDIDLKLN